MIIMQLLHIDRKTISELELLETDSHRKSVFEIINQTETSGGRDKLMRLFLKPEFDLTDIMQKHEAVRHILQHPKDWEFPLNQKLMDLVEYYYFLNIDPVISNYKIINYFEGIRYWIIYRSYYKTFKEGIKNLYLLFRHLNKFYLKVKGHEMPTFLKRIIDQMGGILQEKFIGEILESEQDEAPGFLSIFTVDKAFREDYKEQMALLIDLIYELDLIQSMAKVHQKYNLCFPEFVEMKTAVLEIGGLRHLFVNKCEANDVLLERDHFFMFVTGPNMAGKTTYLKACGVAVFMAHLGFGVPAHSMKLAPFDGIFSSINAADNLSKGYSYFYSEVMRVKEAAENLKKNSRTLFIFDELFRGTNVKDAFDGSLLVIRGFLNWPGSVFLLSSHLIELARELSKEPGISFHYFDSEVKDGKPLFNYKLIEGISDERLGLLILKNEKIDQLLNPGS
jgi:DNA mismatch repair ATPase MutS